MPRRLMFTYEGTVSELPLRKLDPDRLYGSERRVVVDADGVECAPGWLAADGRTAVPGGCASACTVDETGTSIAPGDLITVDEHGEVLDPLPSTVGIEQELYGPVPIQRLLDHDVRSVHILDDTGLSAPLRAALDAGAVFETEYRYSTSPITQTLFLLRNAHGTFALIGTPVDCPFIHPGEQTGVDAWAEDAPAPDEDLDFDF